jgi:Fe-S oxidoreductase
LWVLFRLLRFYQWSGLRSLLRETLVRIFPKELREAEQLLPHVPAQAPHRTSERTAPGEPVRTVAMLDGCVMPNLNPRTHEATIRVLQKNGVYVRPIPSQGCCGALNLHAGDRVSAKKMARKNVDAFLSTDCEAIVVNSAGCGSTMKEYGHLLADEPEYSERAEMLASKVKDIAEYLHDLPFERPLGHLEGRVTYQDSCHLVHGQRISSAPREILRSIPGLELRELGTPDRCCGSAGIYSIVQRKMSLSLLREKIDDVAATGADIIATSNPGCILQLEAGVRIKGLNARVCHVVELLDQSYSVAEGRGENFQ